MHVYTPAWRELKRVETGVQQVSIKWRRRLHTHPLAANILIMPIMTRYCVGAPKCLTSGGKVNANGL